MAQPSQSVTLTAGDCRAVISPRGGGPQHLSVGGRDLLQGYGGAGEPGPAPLSANVVLAPWPNRTRDGEFTVAGRRYNLEINEPDRSNAIHGFVDDAVWTVSSSGEDAVTLTIDPGTLPGWPWPLHLEVAYRAAVDAQRRVPAAERLTGADPRRLRIPSLPQRLRCPGGRVHLGRPRAQRPSVG